jgi:putative membrane protein
MNAYDLARGLHILAVIAWMAGLLFLPRLFAYDAEQAAKPEPLKSEMQTLLRSVAGAV